MKFVDKPFGSNVAILSPENAYMAGVLKTNNLEDLRRFERVFPLNPKIVMDTVLALREEYSKRPEITPKDKLDVLFLTLAPKCFLPAQAAGWDAILHFSIQGAGDYTVAVSDGQVSTKAGLHGLPTCRVDSHYEDFRKLLRYELIEDSGLVETKQLDSWQDEESMEAELSDDMLEAVAGGKGSCGAEGAAGQACGADACGAAAGAGSACGAAACAAAAGVGTACGADACGAAVGVGTVCGAAACPADAGVGTACGADAGVGA